MKVYSHDHPDVHTVKGNNILVYWPHGFGDWIMLTYILPLLESSNRYWITRFGDDYVSVLEGCEFAQPAYLGVSSTLCAHGETYGIPHFGIRSADGRINDVRLPLALSELCVTHDINTLFWPGFPETYGSVAYPYHSKPRYLIPHMVPVTTQRCLHLDKPLQASVKFNTSPGLLRFIEARLQSWTGFGERKLCLVGRTGFTAHAKNWGHQWREDSGNVLPEGEECRDFMRLMLQRDPKWMFLSLEDQIFDGPDTMRSKELHCFTYADLFGKNGDITLPFGTVLKALMELSDLFVGVPSGPYCLSMAKPELATVGIWLDHFPSWYCEPKPAAIHVISRNVYDLGRASRTGSFLACEGLEYRAHTVDTCRISGEQAIAAVEELFG